jgi:serralysin
MTERYEGSLSSFGAGERFHAAYGGGTTTTPFSALNADERGDFGQASSKPSLTVDEAATQLGRVNVTWGTALGQPATVTFAFRSTAPATNPDDTEGFIRFNPAQVAATVNGLNAWSDVANIRFQQVADADGYSNNATILFGNYTSGQDGSAAFAYLPGAASVGSNSGDVWVNGSLGYNTNPVAGGYGPQVLTHEIGHAIGLSHPSAYNAEEGVSLTYAANASYYEDSRQYSIMSYFSESNTGGRFQNQYAAVPLLDDIAAAQRLYGANMTTRTGDTVYGFNSTADRAWFSATAVSPQVVFAIWDAGGTDTLDASGYSRGQTLDLRQGSFSDFGGLTGNVSIAVGAAIENAVGGAGADTIIGNSGANRLAGGAGADTIDGGLGSDTVVFTGVRSSYTITEQDYLYTVVGPDGVIDTVQNIEILQFSDQAMSLGPTDLLVVNGDLLDNVMVVSVRGNLYGAGGDDTLTGGAIADNLDGGSGDDRISGGGGDDQLIGGLGDDTVDGGAGVDLFNIYVETLRPIGEGSTVDLATGLTSGAIGNDRISNVENILGSRYADTLTGDAGANSINGNGGADTIVGGDGADTLSAGFPELGGGAPDVIKGQATANGATISAVNLDGWFDAIPRVDIDVRPSATVQGVTHGGYEYYAFTAAAGATIVLDIDGAGFDSTLRLLGPDGNELAINDDNNIDNNEATDSQITFRATTAGVYYVQVGAWAEGTGDELETQAPPAGQTYTLHVGVSDHAVVPTMDIGSRIEGGAGDDRINGSIGRDILFGGDGRDFMIGAAGDDNLQGNKGNDVIQADSGADFVFGGQDDDDMSGGSGDDWMNGNLGADTLNGGDGNDTMFGGQANDVMDGYWGNDRLVGDLGNDTLNGDDGDDILEGMAGADMLNGGAGADLMVGGAGDDLLRGGQGPDLLTGSEGADVFRFEAGSGPLAGTFAGDTVVDFTAGDRLSVDGLSIGGFAGAGAAASFALALQSANAAFAASAVTAVGVAVGADVYVFFDGVDADRSADVAALLVGVSPADLDLGDFT